MDLLAQRKVRQRHHLVVVQAMQYHRIEANSLKTACNGSINTLENCVEFADSGDGLKARWIEAVQTDIDRADPRSTETSRLLREMATVGRERQRVEAGQFAKACKQFFNAATNQRLSARHANFLHPELGE